MEKKYIVSLDQGTTSSRTLVFDSEGNIVSLAQYKFTQFFPHLGWVEHDPMEILETQEKSLKVAVGQLGQGGAESVAAIGITNQRETTIVWDRRTGEPVYNAIVWQDRRTAPYCDKLISEGWMDAVRDKTGLLIDAYFSATKLKWILDNVPGAKERAAKGDLLFGTVDTWLVWNLTGRMVHVTDVTNASRTMLFNIHSLEWDSELLELFDIPAAMLPQVRSCSEIYGQTEIGRVSVPIAGIAGDQQASLIGHMCIGKGDVKNTYGTGCFFLMNTGDTPITSSNKLVTTIAFKIGDKLNYALEGSIFVACSLFQWIRDNLKIIRSSKELEPMALTVPDNGGVYFVPALTGMGAPYWDSYATGTITGITRGTTAAHIARAALEGVAFETMDVMEAMERDSGIRLSTLKVDGGGCNNNLMMQIQADLIGADVVRSKVTELTAMGAAYLAGLATGVWSSLDHIKSNWQADRTFSPSADKSAVEKMKEGWKLAVEKSLTNK